MSPHSELRLERFEYSRVGTEWAVLRLLARLGAELGAPANARLMIDRGANYSGSLPYPACASAIERRLLGYSKRGRGGAGAELLWCASFAVPLEVARCRNAVFKLTALGGLALALPPPGARIITQRPLALASIRQRDPHPRIAVGQVRQRCVAIATAVVVTTTSTPAVALAATGVGSAPTPQSTTTAAPSLTAVPQPATPAPQPTTTAPQPATVAPTVPQPGTTTVHRTTPAPAQGAQPTAAAGTGSATSTTPPTAHTRARPLEPADLTRKSGRHAGLSHPVVIHFLSRTAHRAPHVTTEPVTKLPACVSKTGSRGLPIAATFEPGTARRTGQSGSGTQTKCAPPADPKAAKKHKRAATPNEPAATPHHRQAATFAPGGKVPGDGAGRRTFPSGTPTSTDQHPRAAGKRPSGGAPLQPLGGHTERPGSGTSTGSVPTLSASPPGFLAPAAWTGTVSADPALTGAVTDLSGLLSNGDRPPSFLIPVYMQAGRRYGVPWEVLAAINAIESDYGRDLSTSSAGALGWMQFEPSTWREWGVAVDRHSVPNPYDPRDAIFSAARYLAAAGAKQDISKAVFAYNHATWYVDEVLSRAQAIASHAQFERQTVKHGSFSVYFATGLKKHPTVRYSGGILSHYDRLIASANMVSAANFPYLYGGGHEQPARFQPFDCSGSVSYVVQQAGYKVPTTVSGEIPIWKFPSGPGRVTIFYNPTHTFMRIGNRYFGTSGFARPAGGAGWFDVDKLPAGYLAQFREVHIPRLGVNSFAPAKQVPNTTS
jgi:hypothetical protein